MSLNPKADFLMHGVVLQNRVFGPASAMFHVKHSCVKSASGPVAHACDVSRETIFCCAAVFTHPARAAMFHVKHFCVIPPREFVSRDSQSYIPAPAPTRKSAS